MKKTFTTLVAAIMASATWAASFTYQGALFDEAGNPVAGQKTIEFRIYDTSAGTPLASALWGRLYSVQLDAASGLFNLEVADDNGTELTENKPAQKLSLSEIFASSDAKNLYIGIKVKNSSGEIVPRQKLSPVPSAVFAHDVKNAKGSFTVAGTLNATDIKAQRMIVENKLEVRADLAVGGVITGNGTIPIGGIIMWSGSKIPQGWVLCNGQNGTPNLSGRFVVASGGNGETSYAIGNTGGNDKVTLSADNLPKHSHKTTFKTVGYAASWNSSKEAMSGEGKDKNNGNVNKNTSEAGGSKPFDNRPKFYALAFIMRVQ